MMPMLTLLKLAAVVVVSVQALAAHPDFPGERKGPLVAGIGFGHTSTTSLAAALRRMGLRTKHWAPQYTLKLMCLRLTGGKQPGPGSHLELNENVTREEAVKNFEWGWEALSDTDAILDEPVNVFWREIYARFPDTLFILSQRNVTAWAESEYAWYDHDEDGRMRSTARFNRYWRWCRRIRGIDCQDKLLEYSYGSSRPTKSDLVEAYHQHVEDVRNTIPAKQLLEMDISAGDGFDKLAPFLGRKVPKRGHHEMEFPHDCNGHCIHEVTSLIEDPRPRGLKIRARSPEMINVNLEEEGHRRLCNCDGQQLPFSSEDDWDFEAI